MAFQPDALYVDKHWGEHLYFHVLPAEAVLSGEIPCPRRDQVRGRLEETVKAHRERTNPDLILSVGNDKND